MGRQRFGSGYSSKYWHRSHINARVCEQGCTSYNHFISKGNILQSVTVIFVDKGGNLQEFHQYPWHLSWLWLRLCMFSTIWLELWSVIYKFWFEFTCLIVCSDNLPWETWWAYLPHWIRNLLLYISEWCSRTEAGQIIFFQVINHALVSHILNWCRDLKGNCIIHGRLRAVDWHWQLCIH